MKEASISRARYGAAMRINGYSYSLNPRTKWYEIFLPFNLLYVGHEVGPVKPAIKIPRNNYLYYIIGWFLSVVISSILVKHILKIENTLLFALCLFLFTVGVSVIIYRNILRKKNWLNGNLITRYPIIYLQPKIKAIAMIMYSSAMINAVALFLLWDSFTDPIQDWRTIVVMPFIGAFWGITGFFASIPVARATYTVKNIKYQGREITVTELEQIIQSMAAKQMS